MGARMLLVGVILVASVGLADIPSQAQRAAGYQLRVALGALPRTLDPTFDTSALAMGAYRLLYEALVVIDAAGEVQPLLATSWKSLDVNTWQFSLRRGVRWHNGDPFTARDVKFTIDRILDPATRAPWRARIDLVKRVDVVDDYTVNITTERPFALLLQGLAVNYILPAKYWAEQGEAGFNRRPVGTGMYRFAGWERENYLAVIINRDYWGERPEVASVMFRHMPEAATRVAALEAREVDIAYAVPPEMADRLRARGFGIATANIGQNFVVNFSAMPGTPIADKRVRQALNYAVDKDTIIATVVGGFGRRLEGQIVGPHAFGFNPRLKAYPYDPAEARRLLTAAGYGDGFEVTLIGTQGRYPKDKEISEAVAGYLGRVGVRVRLDILESGVWLSRLYVKGALGPMWVIGWNYVPGLDAQLPMLFLRCESIVWVMCHADYDRIFEEASRTVNAPRRRELLHRLAEIVRDEAPMIFLHELVAIVGVSPQVRGLRLLPDWSFDVSRLTVVSR